MKYGAKYAIIISEIEIDMVNTAEVLLELYGIRSAIEHRFLMGFGDLDGLKRVEENIALIEKRGSNAGYSGFTVTTDTNNLFVFTFSKDGNLARKTEVKGDRPYALEKNSRRYKVFKALVSCKSKDFCKTTTLAKISECSVNDFSKTCGELKTQLCKHFSGIRRDEIIDSKPRSGYRIHQKARIIEIP